MLYPIVVFNKIISECIPSLLHFFRSSTIKRFGMLFSSEELYIFVNECLELSLKWLLELHSIRDY
ncbi:unnamed protein product [Brassica oleracea var. botrytis]